MSSVPLIRKSQSVAGLLPFVWGKDLPRLSPWCRWSFSFSVFHIILLAQVFLPHFHHHVLDQDLPSSNRPSLAWLSLQSDLYLPVRSHSDSLRVGTLKWTSSGRHNSTGITWKLLANIIHNTIRNSTTNYNIYSQSVTRICHTIHPKEESNLTLIGIASETIYLVVNVMPWSPSPKLRIRCPVMQHKGFIASRVRSVSSSMNWREPWALNCYSFSYEDGSFLPAT